MTELDIAFLWHMHQPYYPDPIAGSYPMPWVRLHAIKGYFDMAKVLEQFPKISITINLTPSLTRQIREYTEQKIFDDFYQLSEKPALELNNFEKTFLLKNFFLCRKETMIQPHPCYYRLLLKRGLRPGAEMEKVVDEFSTQDFLDLQVWFNLTWFGFMTLKQYPELREFQKKGKNFTEEEKGRILEIQKEIMTKIIPLYKELWSQGRLEVSTTPFYHPILPLLCDTEIARSASSDIILPTHFSYPEDAKLQVLTGLDYMEQSFEKKPIGMWPGEGAVSDQALSIIAEAGINWLSTCEQNLLKTIKNKSRMELIYQPYRFRDTNLKLVFRDQELSDLISFYYSGIEAEVAVSDLLRRLEGIKKNLQRSGKERALLVIALDGENPWEAYPESGEDFILTLYQTLSEQEEVRITTLGNALISYHPEPLPHLEPGTWIQGNFEIWIGDPEKNLAWEYLNRVRKDAEEMFKSAEPNKLELARSELFSAEGSDWFWWYGDDFYSELDEDFDAIYRIHLKNVYLALNQPAPLFLEEPVKFDHPIRLSVKPSGFISPVLDGKESSFFEWQNAGVFDIFKGLKARYSEEPFFSKIYFGFDQDNLYLRLDPHQPEGVKEQLQVEIKFEKPIPVQILFPYHSEKEPSQKFLVLTRAQRIENRFEKQSIRKDKILELAISFSELGFAEGEEAWFRVYVYQENRLLARYPRDGLITFLVPGKDFETRMWSV